MSGVTGMGWRARKGSNVKRRCALALLPVLSTPSKWSSRT